MGVTDEDAQMDLALYIGNFDLESIFYAEPDQEKHYISQKHIDLSSISSIGLLLDFMESQKKHNTKLT